MRKRYERLLERVPVGKMRVCVALREAMKEGYGWKQGRADVMAGLIVGVVALPLSMALAIASGVEPQHGVYTAIVAGFLIALLGGSRVQVSGPTAAFVVILAPISGEYGLAGLALATSMAGVMLVVMGACRLGKLIEFVPYPVTTGFTSGIAVVIATLQVKDVLGLEVGRMPDEFVGKVRVLIEHAGEARWGDMVIGGMTLGVLLGWGRVTRKVPAPLVALPLAAVAAWAMQRWVAGFEAATVASRFGGIPRGLPGLVMPWNEAGPGGERLVLSVATVEALFPSALAIAMLGAIESLLSAVVADGMTGRKHDPDAELVAQGVGNLVAPFFGGFAATGAIARTATGVRSGAVSPISAMIHAGFVLAAVVALAPALGYLPMAGLAALLLVVAKNMAEVKHFAFVVRYAPRSDAVVLVTCFALTVVFDMVVAVGVGLVLAAVLFMKRMADVTSVELIGAAGAGEGFGGVEQAGNGNGANDGGRGGGGGGGLPREVVVYRIGGPLFFGAAERAMAQLRAIAEHVQVVVLDMSGASTIDATGLVNLDSTVSRLGARGVYVILAGVNEHVYTVLERAELTQRDDRLSVRARLSDGIELARLVAGG